MRLPQLTACPVCHSILSERVAACPNCETELSPYYEQHEAARALINQAANAVSRGEMIEAKRLLGDAERMLPSPVEAVEELRTVILLQEHRLEDALRAASALPDDCSGKPRLLDDIAAASERVENAKMHFNLALTAARQGSLADAAYHVEKTLSLAPHLPEPWRLAAKIALKREDFAAAQRYLTCGAELFPRDSYLAPLAAEIKQAK